MNLSLHKHMVKRLPKGEQMELLRQLVIEYKLKLEEKPEDDERAMAILTRALESRMAQL